MSNAGSIRSRRRLGRWAAGFVAVLALGAGVGVTLGAFSSQTSNPGNSYSAASSFGGIQMATGSYIGDDSDDRPVADAGFQPDVVIVKNSNGHSAMIRTSTMTGDSSKRMAETSAFENNRIQSLDASGFTVGSEKHVNEADRVFHWIAFKAGTGSLKVGSYTGNGTSQAITGAGFSPEYVAVLPAAGDAPVQRFTGMTSTFEFDADTGAAARVTSLDADGFSVGGADEVNKSGATYHYVAFNDVPGSIDVGSYAGNGTNDRSVTGVGFQPNYVMVRANDTTTAKEGNHRPASMTGTDSLVFDNDPNIATGTKALESDGFKLGTDASVNASGTTYHYIAFKNAATGCSNPVTQVVTADVDAHVEEDQPTTNFGTAGDLTVRAHAADNSRALVHFPLPAAGSGCSVTAAKLRLETTSFNGGLTYEVFRAASAWTETGVTWNTQPATAGTASTAATFNGWVEWAVQSQVQAMYAGANNGLIVKDSVESTGSTNTNKYSSREGADPPQLAVTFG